MPKILVLFIFLGFFSPLVAQIKKPDHKIELLTPFRDPVPIYGGFGADITTFDDKILPVINLEFGFLPARWLMVGTEIKGFIPSVQLKQVIPESLITVYGGSAGLVIAPVFNSFRKIHPIVPLGFGANWIGYFVDRRQEDKQTVMFQGDLSLYLRPGAGVEVNLAPNIRFAAVYAYRIVRPVELPETDAGVFDGHNISFTLRMGNFYKIQPYTRKRYVTP